MTLLDRLRTAVSPVTRQTRNVPVVPPAPLPATINTFTANITGLGKAGPHAVRPYITDIGPRPNLRPRLSGLLVPPRIRQGTLTGVGSARLTRAQVRKKV